MYGTVFGAALAAAAVLAALSIFAIGLFVVATVIVACVATYAWSRSVEGSRQGEGSVDDDEHRLGVRAGDDSARLTRSTRSSARALNRFDVAFFTESARGVIGAGGGASHAILGTLIITGVAT